MDINTTLKKRSWEDVRKISAGKFLISSTKNALSAFKKKVVQICAYLSNLPIETKVGDVCQPLKVTYFHARG